jgi:hypothetical protein
VILLGTLALAAEPRFPWTLPVDVPACVAPCAVAVPIPLEARGPNDPGDCSDLALLDARGAPVAFACYPGAQATAYVYTRTVDHPSAWVWSLEADEPFDTLEVTLPEDSIVAVTGQTLAGAPLFAGRAWRTQEMSSPVFVLPEPTRTLHVQVDPLYLPRGASIDLRAGRRATPVLDPATLEVPLADTWEVADATTSAFQLPHGLPAGLDVTLRVSADVLHRGVTLTDGDAASYLHVGSGTIRRVALGGFPIEQLTLRTDAPIRSGTLLATIDRAQADPIPATSVLLTAPPRALLLRDPEPGPYVLAAGAPAWTTPPSDLQTAVDALARQLHPVAATVGPATANPDWVPPELADGLAAAAVPLPASAHPRWSSPVTGAAGLARMAVPRDVLAVAREDYGDLRLLDADRNQIPYVVRRVPGTNPWDGVTVVRSERPGVTVLDVTLPASPGDEHAPLASLSLTTSATRFTREVHVLRGRGAGQEVLRAQTWWAHDAPGALVFGVDAAVGDALRVEIMNGQDAPLPEITVGASWPRVEVIAWLPEGGATLVYGDPTLEAPGHDLESYADELIGRAAVDATIGPRAEATPPALGIAERIALGLGLFALAAGLGWLIVALLRTTPAPSDEGAAEA